MDEVDRGYLICLLVCFFHMVRVTRCTSGKDVGSSRHPWTSKGPTKVGIVLEHLVTSWKSLMTFGAFT